MSTRQTQGPCPAAWGHSATSQGWRHGSAGEVTCWRGLPRRGGGTIEGPRGAKLHPEHMGRWRLQPGGGHTVGWVSRQTPAHTVPPEQP